MDLPISAVKDIHPTIWSDREWVSEQRDWTAWFAMKHGTCPISLSPWRLWLKTHTHRWTGEPHRETKQLLVDWTLCADQLCDPSQWPTGRCAALASCSKKEPGVSSEAKSSGQRINLLKVVRVCAQVCIVSPSSFLGSLKWSITECSRREDYSRYYSVKLAKQGTPTSC